MDKLKKKPNATIYDIAHSINISASTVSRAINNKSTVSKKTGEKVLKAVRSLNYSPNIAAIYLKTNNAVHNLYAGRVLL